MAKLIVTDMAQNQTEVELRDTLRIGRDQSCDLTLPGSRVSRQHVLLRRQGDAWQAEDCGSTNGTRLNDTPLSPGVAYALTSGDCLIVGEWQITFHDEHEEMAVSPDLLPVPTATFAVVAEQVIGRDPACDIVLDSPNVSRRHCRITQNGQGFLLEDLNSRNGTFLNGVLVGGPEPLQTGDEVEVGLNRFVFRNRTLEHYAQDGTVRLDITDLSQTVHKSGKPMQLLQNVSFVLPPREFVAIVGASGAGKSTLLNAMTGFRPATSGAILLNGVDFYSHLELFRTIIGYVPQEDIVHRELTVASVLRYAARLRLPPDTNNAEIERLMDTTLAELELTHRKTAQVSTLSGGERKRVNVGVELLTRPSLLFLDEPTSGLDPGLERKFVELVKKLAREGRSVVMVTHATSSIADPSGWDQFGILCSRYLDTFKGDMRNTLFLLAQAPIIALLLALVFRADIFGNGSPLSPGFSPKKSGLLLFCMVISALLFGIVNAAREITKESAIYRRERLVNLRAAPYLLSKAAVLSVLCLLQTLLLVGIVRLRIDFHLDSGAFVTFFITTLLATLCGMLLGLTVSAAATTNDQAMSLVPVVVLPQIIFSGLLEIEALDILSRLMPSYWAYGALGHLTHIPAHAPENHFDIQPAVAWLALIAIGTGYGLLSLRLLQRKDQRL